MDRFAKTGLVVLLFAITATGIGGLVWLQSKHVDEQKAAEQACAAQVAACERTTKDERDAKEALRVQGEAKLHASQAELEELRHEHEEAAKQLEAVQALTAKFRKMIDAGRLKITVRHGRMVVKLPASVLFESGSADLSKDGVSALREVAGILKQVEGRRFMVAGHTDSVPVGSPTTPFMNNLDLSTSRALIVAQSLIRAGMNPAHLIAAGYGEYEPVADNRTEAGRRENRRIEIVLMPNLTELPELARGASDAGAPDAGAAPSHSTTPEGKHPDAGASPAAKATAVHDGAASTKDAGAKVAPTTKKK